MSHLGKTLLSAAVLAASLLAEQPPAPAAPKPVAALVPGSYKYKANLTLGGQSMAMDLVTVIKEENGAWNATDTMTTPMGDVTDSAVLEKTSLILLRRSVKNGPMALVVEFKDNKAAGSVKRDNQEKPISAPTGGPLFADAAGAPQAIGCLPLADGYQTSFRNFDLLEQKPKLMRLKVVASESVTVPAGSFESYKVEISADDGPEKVTMWIAKVSRKPVKMFALIPDMGNATMSAELLE